MIRGIDHIGVAVHSLEERIPFYRDVLGLTEVIVEEVPDQRVRVATFTTPHGNIELLEPTDEQSPIARFLVKHGEGIHHLALGTDDTEKELQEVQEHQLPIIDKSPRPGAHGALIGFVHPRATGGVLLEFCQRRND
jgi:methylmalonyl-CoA/ethylmalonyl-CoA epimerase